jgi:hypothetical protein
MSIRALEPGTAGPTAIPAAEIARIARALAHAVNNRLVLPLGLLELLEERADIPADLRPLFGPARQALQEMAIEAVQLGALSRLDQ